jgi:hypothetical protein
MKQVLILSVFVMVAGCSETIAELPLNPIYDRDARICKAVAARAVPINSENSVYRRNEIAEGCMVRKGW